ncbi:MAG: hypothetical protein ACREQ9_26800 [Candidatus Binatia bacterium]
MRFPSVEWFDSLRRRAAQDPDRYRRLGTVDIVLVAKIDRGSGSELFELTFSGYGCTNVRRIPQLAAASPGAVVLEGTYETWREMIESIARSGKADLAHTLNTLTLADFPLRVSAENQLDVDRFYRYQETLQEFFDEAAGFATDFGAAEGEGRAMPA